MHNTIGQPGCLCTLLTQTDANIQAYYFPHKYICLQKWTNYIFLYSESNASYEDAFKSMRSKYKCNWHTQVTYIGVFVLIYLVQI